MPPRQGRAATAPAGRHRPASARRPSDPAALPWTCRSERAFHTGAPVGLGTLAQSGLDGNGNIALRSPQIDRVSCRDVRRRLGRRALATCGPQGADSPGDQAHPSRASRKHHLPRGVIALSDSEALTPNATRSPYARRRHILHRPPLQTFSQSRPGGKAVLIGPCQPSSHQHHRQTLTAQSALITYDSRDPGVPAGTSTPFQSHLPDATERPTPARPVRPRSRERLNITFRVPQNIRAAGGQRPVRAKECLGPDGSFGPGSPFGRATGPALLNRTCPARGRWEQRPPRPGFWGRPPVRNRTIPLRSPIPGDRQIQPTRDLGNRRLSWPKRGKSPYVHGPLTRR